jgi:flavin reductase (DIM6/NTAB) family NADH-FMN oxidoreductase RutF
MTAPEAGQVGEPTPERLRHVLGHFASGVTVVTALDGEEPVGFTCQSFSSLSLDPPLVLLAPSLRSSSWPRISAAGVFCVNILSEHQQQLALDFAVRGEELAAAGAHKFSTHQWEEGPGGGGPVLAGAIAWVRCRIEDIYPGGDHHLVVARVEQLVTAEQVDPEHSHGLGPLLFYKGGFGLPGK